MRNLFFKLLVVLLLVAHCGTAAAQSGALKAQLDSMLAAVGTQPDSVRYRAMYRLALAYEPTDGTQARKWALASAADALRLGKETDYANALSVLGMLAKNDGNFKKAIDYQLKALKIHERKHDQRGIMICCNDIGILNKKIKLFRAAIPYFERVVALAEVQYHQSPNGTNKKNYGSAVAYGLANLGTTYYELHDFAKSRDYQVRALAQAKAVDNLDAQSVALTNLGDLASADKRFPEALRFMEQSLAIDEAAGNDYGRVETLISIGQTAELAKQPQAAEAALKKAAAGAEKMHLLIELQSAYQELSKLYASTGRPQQAVQYYQKLLPLKDSLYNNEITQQVSELQTKYETEKKEAQNRLQAAQLRTQEQVIRRRNTQLVAGLLVAGLLAGLAYLLYTRRRLRREVEFAQERQQLTQLRAQAVLDAEEAERRRIGTDLHDGVGQLLTVAKLNLGALGEQLAISTVAQQAMLQNALDVVDESFREVRQISHNLMPNSLIKRGLAQAVRDFLSKVSPDGRLKINIETVGLDSNGRLGPNVENVLFRVIQELVQNIIKHARATEMTLQLVRSPEELTVLVEDNGVGFDPAALGAESGGIGLKNIESRLAFLGGRAEFDSRPGHGTTVTLEVPLVAMS